MQKLCSGITRFKYSFQNTVFKNYSTFINFPANLNYNFEYKSLFYTKDVLRPYLSIVSDEQLNSINYLNKTGTGVFSAGQLSDCNTSNFESHIANGNYSKCLSFLESIRVDSPAQITSLIETHVLPHFIQKISNRKNSKNELKSPSNDFSSYLSHFLDYYLDALLRLEKYDDIVFKAKDYIFEHFKSSHFYQKHIFHYILCAYFHLQILKQGQTIPFPFSKSFRANYLVSESIYHVLKHFVQTGKMKEAYTVLDFMSHSENNLRKPLCQAMNLFIDKYWKEGKPHLAERTFAALQNLGVAKRIYPDHITFESMILGYLSVRDFESAMKTYKSIPSSLNSSIEPVMSYLTRYQIQILNKYEQAYLFCKEEMKGRNCVPSIRFVQFLAQFLLHQSKQLKKKDIDSLTALLLNIEVMRPKMKSSPSLTRKSFELDTFILGLLKHSNSETIFIVKSIADQLFALDTTTLFEEQEMSQLLNLILDIIASSSSKEEFYHYKDLFWNYLTSKQIDPTIALAQALLYGYHFHKSVEQLDQTLQQCVEQMNQLKPRAKSAVIDMTIKRGFELSKIMELFEKSKRDIKDADFLLGRMGDFACRMNATTLQNNMPQIKQLIEIFDKTLHPSEKTKQVFVNLKQKIN